MANTGVPGAHRVGFGPRGLRWVLFLVLPVCLLAPCLYYSLSTPLGLVDDFVHTPFLLILNSPEAFYNWLLRRDYWNFNIGHRYRPFLELHTAIIWQVFGTTAWPQHLLRWMFHGLSAGLFLAALLGVFSSRCRRNAFETLVPASIFLYVFLIFPNVPAARLYPQELYSVVFLALCNWAAVRLFIQRTSRPARTYIWFCLGYLGLSTSKETNIGVLLWLLIAYYGALGIKRQASADRLMAGLPLLAILAMTVYRVYEVQARTSLGYGEQGLTVAHVYDILAIVMKGLLQVETSMWIAAAFALLLAFVTVLTAIKLWNRKFDDEMLFAIFLGGQFFALLLVLGVSYDVSLRYWQVLVPILAMLLALGAKWFLQAIPRWPGWPRHFASGSLVAFLVYFVATNYHNFLYQTIVQHSARQVDHRLVGVLSRLMEDGGYVQLTDGKHEVGWYTAAEEVIALHAYFTLFMPLSLDKEYDIHTKPPSSEETPLYLVELNRHRPLLEVHSSIEGANDYPLLNLAGRLAAWLQSNPPTVSLDGGVRLLGDYSWTIYHLPEPIDDHLRHRFAEFASQQGALAATDWRVALEGKRMVWFKRPCLPEDIHATFFLHVYPQHEANLSQHRRRHGFNPLDFNFIRWGALAGGICVAERTLPPYAIRTVSTGQYTDQGQLWKTEIAVEAPLPPRPAASI